MAYNQDLHNLLNISQTVIPRALLVTWYTGLFVTSGLRDVIAV